MDEDLSATLRWPSPASSARADAATDHAAPPRRLTSLPADPDRDLDEREPVELMGAVAGAPLATLGQGSASARVLIEAYDRLGERLLERLRELRVDIDADLAALRSEVAGLRHAVDDVGDRVQLRQLRASVEELRSDVTSLRRVVLEWPELERVSDDVSSLRADVAALVEQGAEREVADVDPAGATALADITDRLEELRMLVTAPEAPAVAPVVELPAELRAELAELRAAVDALRRPDAPPVAALAPLLTEVVELRNEVVALRRRISLRVGSDPTPVLDDAQLDDLARRIADQFER